MAMHALHRYDGCPSLHSSKLTMPRELTGLAGGFQKGFSRLAFAAPAIERVPTGTIGGTPASAARPFGPLLTHTFDCFLDARDAALSRCLELENNRLDDAASIASGAVHHVSLKMLFRLGNADSDGV